MTWEALFEDLTSGLESEWEYERAAREAERQRLRIAQLTCHERFTALSTTGSAVAAYLRDGRVLTGEIVGAGADWLAVRQATPAVLDLVPEHAIVSVSSNAQALRTTIPQGEVATDAAGLLARLTFGYIARDLARRRVPVRVHAQAGWQHAGTIDRAGADHLDLAIHDLDVPRRSGNIRAVHLVTFAHITSIALEPSGFARVSGRSAL